MNSSAGRHSEPPEAVTAEPRPHCLQEKRAHAHLVLAMGIPIAKRYGLLDCCCCTTGAGAGGG